MQDLRKLLDLLNETTAGAVASVAQPLGATVKRTDEGDTGAKTPEVLEYGNWENSAMTTSSKLKQERQKSAKVVKSIYGEDVQAEAKNPAQQAAIAIAKKEKIKESKALADKLAAKLKGKVEKHNKDRKDTEEKVKAAHEKELKKKDVAEAKLDEDDLILMPGQGPKLKPGLIPHEIDRTDHEVEMARSDLYQAGKNALIVLKLIKDISEEEGLEGWVQEKIIKANDYLNTIREYLESKHVTGEGLAGAALGGLAGATITKTPSGAMTGASIGSEIQDALAGEQADESMDGVAPGTRQFTSEEDMEEGVVDTLKKAGGKALDLFGGPGDEELKRLLQKRMGVPQSAQHGKPAGAAPREVKEEEVEESGLQAYLGNKKYGKEGMDALRKAGREGASKEKMAQIRAKYDKLDEEGVAEGQELYGLRTGDTVRAEVNGQTVQGDVIDIFPDTMEVELLLRGPNSGQTVTVDVRDTEALNEQGGMKKKGDRMVPNCVPKESQEKIAGKYDPEEFDAKVSRLGKMAKEGPRKTVWDPVKRVYKTVPVAKPENEVDEGKTGPGLWANIRARRDSGKRMRKPGEEGAPSDEALKAARRGSKNESLDEVVESKCLECGGPAFSEASIAEAKDACYNKVKSRYKVWPSAYASGALVKCRKVGAKNWGNKS